MKDNDCSSDVTKISTIKLWLPHRAIDYWALQIQLVDWFMSWEINKENNWHSVYDCRVHSLCRFSGNTLAFSYVVTIILLLTRYISSKWLVMYSYVADVIVKYSTMYIHNYHIKWLWKVNKILINACHNGLCDIKYVICLYTSW